MSELRVIHYYPSLREETGSVNAAIIVAYLEECFKEKGKLFYKFMEPCKHSKYVEGESVVEELQMTSTEFRTAFKHIGVVYKSKKAFNKSEDKFQGKMYLSYYDRITKLTYYVRNNELVNRKLHKLEESPKVGQAKEKERTVESQTIEKQEIKKQSIKKQELDEQIIGNQEIGEWAIEKQTMWEQEIEEQEIKSQTSENQAMEFGEIEEQAINQVSKFTVSEDDNVRNDELQDGIIDYNTKTNYNYSTTNNNYSKTNNTKTNNKTYRQTQTNEIANLDLETPLESVRILFNQICHSHQQIMEWSESQKNKLSKLWVDYEGQLSLFKTVFEKLEESDFLSGRVKKWKAQLDWIFKPEHFMDILNGRYRNFRKESPSQKNGSQDMLHRDWDYDEIERLDQELIDRRLEGRICL